MVVPTLNAAAGLTPALSSVIREEIPGYGLEIVVCDGGSRDSTVALAEACGARVVKASPGRGSQLQAGAASARGEWLLFLHADTCLADGWGQVVRELIAAPGNGSRAGCFRFALDDDAPAARFLERIVALRTRLGLPYGDQGLVISRDFYHRLGGHPDWPLMEDVALVRRIGRKRLICLEISAVTSAVRYRRSGYLARSLRNSLCLALYFLGLPPRLITRLYG